MKILNWFKQFWNNVTNGRFTVSSDGSIGNERTSPFPGLGLDSSYDTQGGKFVKGLLGIDSNTSSPSLYGALTSWLNSMSGEHMVNADVERNAMQMQNVEDVYQRQVSGMQKAGLNPALMYQSGVSSAPSAPAPTQPGLNMSDIMQAMLLGKQARLLDAQANNTDADTDKKKSETAYQSLINKYYPSVTDSQIKKVLSEAGLNDKTIEEIGSRIELQDLEKDLRRIDKIIKQAEADEASEFYKARREYEQAQGEKAKAEKAELVVRAAIEQIERNFMEHTNTRMGSSTVIAVASAIGTLLSHFQLPGSATPSGSSGLPFDNEEFRSSLKSDLKKLFDWIDSHSTAVD